MINHFKEDYKNKYKLLELIGEGNYTQVYQGENKNTKELRAIKIVKLKSIKLLIKKEYSTEEAIKEINNYIEKLNNEIKLMELCGKNNENSVKYFESYETEDEFVIIMELCNESLKEYAKEKTLNSKEIYNILSQLNNTFKIMRDYNIVHRDLKPENILIKYGDNDKCIIKLCDFGVSKTEKFTRLKTYTGTYGYMAPEIIELTEQGNYDSKCDLWSLGIIIYELYFKEKPYKGINELVILKQINSFGKNKIKKTNNKNLDDLIEKLLEKDPKKRISWDDYFNHAFLIEEERKRREEKEKEEEEEKEERKRKNKRK